MVFDLVQLGKDFLILFVVNDSKGKLINKYFRIFEY